MTHNRNILEVLMDKFLGLARGDWAEVERPIPDSLAYLNYDSRLYSEAKDKFIRFKRKHFWAKRANDLAPCAYFFRLRYEFLVLDITDTLIKLAQIDPVWATSVVLIKDKELRIRVGSELMSMGVFPKWFKREFYRNGVSNK